jgi:hypothetical protein
LKFEITIEQNNQQIILTGFGAPLVAKAVDDIISEMERKISDNEEPTSFLSSPEVLWQEPATEQVLTHPGNGLLFFWTVHRNLAHIVQRALTISMAPA